MKKFAAHLLTATLLTVSPALAEEVPGYADSTLTGNWGGVRDDWAAKGITTDIIYKVDVMSNVSGGIKTGTRLLDNLDVIVGFDGDKLFGSKGTTAVFQLLNNMGGEPDGSLVGSAQGFDNIETPTDTLMVYQAFIQQNWNNDSVSLLAGLYDLNSEFYVTDSSGLFLHSTFGIGTDIAQSGVNGPSIFPTTSLAARLTVKPSADTYVQAAVLDGVSGDPRNGNGNHVFHKIGGTDGFLLAGEIGFLPGGENPTGKLALGGWYYTKAVADLTLADVTERNRGLYLLGEHQLTEALTGFARFGFANEDVNQFDYAWSTGLVYTGLFPTREEGQLGLALHGAHNSDKFRSLAPADASETGLELTYSDNLTNWLAIQPDVQYIRNPSTNPAVKNALVLGSRFTVAF